MSSSSHTSAAREYHTFLPAEGYIHKFRLEASEHVPESCAAEESGVPTVGLAPLLGKFALVALLLAGIAGAGARVLT